MRSIAALVITITLAATNPASAQPLQPAQHARAGWQAIDAGDAQKAQVHFAEALRGAPTEPTVLLGAGLAAHLLGHADHARRSLVDALKYQPSLTAASLLLGEVLYRANDIQGAIHTYEQALVHAPEHAVLSKRLAEWHKEAALHARFAQKLGDHFTVLFEGPAEAALAAKAVEILEVAYWRIGSVLYTYPSDVVTVVLYTREQFRDITQSPEWAGGAFDGRIRVPVRGALQNLAAFERVLTHEYTHAVVRSLAPRGVPQWLNEGLAMYFEGGDLSAHVEHVRNAERPHPLTTLERSFANMDGSAAALAYAQSATAVKRLMDDAGAPAVVGILTDLGRGLPFAEAFQRHANIPYADFSAFALRASARHPVSASRIPHPAPRIPACAPRPAARGPAARFDMIPPHGTPSDHGPDVCARRAHGHLHRRLGPRGRRRPQPRQARTNARH